MHANIGDGRVPALELMNVCGLILGHGMARVEDGRQGCEMACTSLSLRACLHIRGRINGAASVQIHAPPPKGVISGTCAGFDDANKGRE